MLTAARERLRGQSRAVSLRTLARSRRRFAWVLFLVAPGAVLVMDFARRGERIMSFEGDYQLTYLASVAESLLVWSLLLYGAARRRGVFRVVLATLFVVGITFTIGGQRYFHDQYNAYLNVDVSLFASNFKESVLNQLFADIGNYARAKLPLFALAVATVWASTKAMRPRRLPVSIASMVAPLALAGSFFVPTQHRHLQASTPDVLYLHAVGGVIRTQLGFTEQSDQLRPRARSSLPVVLEKQPSRRPNIVFFILESVRADAVCIEHDPECVRTRYSNSIVPGRFPFLEMRSQASSTAISLAVLWAGVNPNESRDVLHTWPLIFDYAKAAGYDTAFWTSQNMMFGNARLWVKNLGVDEFVSATDLDPVADLDMGAPEELLAVHVNEHIDNLTEPFLAVVQFSNVHYPYFLDAEGPMPFQPATTSKAASKNQAFFNLYLNAVHQEDRHVASMLERIRTGPRSDNTVVVLTSDHGEAFREHHHMGHTFSVLEEEVHVPAWIDAPSGVLTAGEEQSLRDNRREYVFHTDLAATIIDLLGVREDNGLAKYREKMPGHSLLRGRVPRRPVPMTNCSGVWSCAFENWGYMKGPLKLEARSWERGWHCYDVRSDPYEIENLGASGCGPLKASALKTFGRLPGQG